MALHMTLTVIEEYSLRLTTVLVFTMYNQITVGNVTLPKAVNSTVKMFAVNLPLVYLELINLLDHVGKPAPKNIELNSKFIFYMFKDCAQCNISRTFR